MIKDWIVAFLDRHRARFAPADWPRPEASEELREFVKGWITAFALREVTEAEADLASQRLATSPPTWRREHVPALLAIVEEIRKERGGPVSVATTREAAEAVSKDCTYCGGAGLTTVWHPAPDPANGVPPTTVAYCVCPVGRWIENAHRRSFPDARKRFADLADVHAGKSRWLAEAPDCPELARRENVTKPDALPGRVTKPDAPAIEEQIRT